MAAEPVEPPVLLREESSAAAEEIKSVKVTLADLCAKGTSHYARKHYEAAADLFAQASEMQAELNGEMNPENAEILFLYGRSLFEVGRSKSDVLGGKSGGEKKKSNGAAKQKKKKVEAVEEAPKTELDKVVEEAAEAVEDQGALGEGGSKPLFQFTGDENFEDSDEEEEGDDDEEDEQSDLEAAFEVLDLARVLLTRKLEQPELGEEKDKSEDSSLVKHFRERLADTHHLLGEISLEDEKFAAAVDDFRAALALKQQLYTEDRSAIVEAHYFLSLALEFASIKPVQLEGKDDEPDTQVDQAIRDEAAKETEAAMNGIKLQIAAKEVELASSANSDDNDILRSQISDARENLTDMQNRLNDLSKPPIDVIGMKEQIFGGSGTENPLGGLFGANEGESAAEVGAKIEEAKKNATDLTNLVRKKKPVEASSAPVATNGKRKAEDDDEEAEAATKKAKVEPAPVTIEDVPESA